MTLSSMSAISAEGLAQAESREFYPQPARIIPAFLMSLAPGSRLGSYDVMARLGAGGMGEVYRARDPRLGRHVAIKILPPAFARDADRSARFEREARMLAALNHPNIAAIYGLEEASGRHYLVMELVEGETLHDRIARAGAIPVDEALTIAHQLAEALEAAHAKDIIHRDIKPANIKVTPERRVKVLDFGLAKSFVPDAHAAEASQVTTFADVNTASAMVLGTPSYMSPEQIRGHMLDHRTDVWAFGCVMYEVLSGQRTFRGATVADTLAAVLQQHVDWRALPASTPDRLAHVLRVCLEKNLDRRWSGFKELRAELSRETGAFSSRATRPLVSGLVVLPLRNLSGDPTQDFLVDGMTETLTWELATLRSLRVISRTSAMRYRSTDKSLPEIASELNVSAVLEGSVVRAGDRVRVRVQLIDAATDTALWTDSYDRPLQDVLVLQNELALAIAREVKVVVTPEEQQRLERLRAIDPASYDAYLRGQFHWSKLTPPDLDLALEYFEEAARREPALGQAGIAAVWTARRQMGLADPIESGRLAKEAAEMALAADDSLAETHYAVALCSCWVDWDLRRMETELRKALVIRPGFAEAHAYLSHQLICLNRSDEAIASIERALEIDPKNELFRSLCGIVLLLSRRYDAAIELFLKARRTSPGSQVIRRGLEGAYHSKGMHAEVMAEVREWFGRDQNAEVLAALAAGDAAGGYTKAMASVGDTLARQSQTTFIPPLDIMRFYVYAGDVEKALQWLEIGFARHDADMPYINCAPTNDLIRDHPRFRNILGRMNLSPT
jgi:non-specific serine/threonine protein kinase